MKTVFVIEQGSYSDYRVVGVFSTRAHAQELVDAIMKSEPYYEPQIAEWTLDPAVRELKAGMGKYLVWMLKDGTIERVEPSDTPGYDLADQSYLWPRSTSAAYAGKGIPDCLNATVWAKDKKHAVKIVNERRTQMIASGEWK